MLLLISDSHLLSNLCFNSFFNRLVFSTKREWVVNNIYHVYFSKKSDIHNATNSHCCFQTCYNYLSMLYLLTCPEIDQLYVDEANI